MSLLRGREVVLTLIDADGEHAVGGLRTRSFTVESRTPGTGSLLSEGWRTLSPCGGERRAEIGGTGVFVSGEAASRVRALALSGGIAEWQVTMAGEGRLTGAFQVSSFRFAADEDGEASFRLALASAGPLAFVPEAA